MIENIRQPIALDQRLTGKRILPALGRVLFLVSLPLGLLGFILPIFGREVGASPVQIGLFFSAFSLVLVLLRPLVGFGLDRIGRKPFLLAGVAGYAAAMLAFAWAADVWGILVARVIQGAAAASLWLATRAMTADAAEGNQRGRAFGGIDQVSSQGTIAGMFISFWVLAPLGFQKGWKPLFLFYAAASVLALAWAWRVLPETRRPQHTQTICPLVWTRPFILLLFVTAVTAASWSLVSPVLMLYLQDRLSADIATLAWAFLPGALVYAVLPARLGWLADRFGRKPLMVISLLAASFTSFWIPAVGSFGMLALLWAFQALCYAAGDPAEQALVADLSGRDQHGRVYGYYTLAAGLGAAAGPLAGGWLYESVGTWAPFYANGVILAVCGLVLVVLLKLPARDRTEPAPGV